MSAQNGTSHSNATKVIDPPTKVQILTKAQILEETTIPALEKQLKEALEKLKELKKT